MPRKIKIVEVGPRDGLQNEPALVDTATKVELINRLALAGFANIESASFVSPKWVPQMADGVQVMQQIHRKPGVVYSALVPNMKGFENAVAAQVDEVVIFGAASETFSQKNINCSIDQSITRFVPVANATKQAGLRLRGSISCCLGCPYEGEILPQAVTKVVTRFRDLGCDEIDIADTIGVGTADQVKRVIEAAAKEFPIEHLAGHYHDTYGQALANVLASLQAGLSIFHSSVAGLGGCPFAKGATGNVSTEDVLYMMRGMGFDTGVDLDQVIAIGAFISRAISRPNLSRAGKALLALSGEAAIN
jgi:hydroxymethylglutaryl-CoA lyase